jgi:DNA-binding transcriptional ArsR family regulator
MITFVLPEGALERIAVAYSPLVEAFFSLDVLNEPKHHPLHHAWVRRARRLSPTLRREIAYFSYYYDPYIPSPIATYPTGDYPSFEAEIERLLGLDDETVRYEFSAPFAGQTAISAGYSPSDAGWREVALARAEEAGVDELARLALDAPRKLIERLCAMLELYWAAAFADEWRRIEREIALSVEFAGAELATTGIYGFLDSLRLEVRTDRAAGRFSFARLHEHVVEIGPDEQLVLNPSYYLWPHVRVNCEAPWPYAVAYPTPFSRRRARVQLPPAELVQPLRALAHDIRLRIVRLVAERPRTTQELAPLLRITESAVSKHLHRLSEAGVLSTRRDGYYVLYRLEEERVDALTSALSGFVRGGSARQAARVDGAQPRTPRTRPRTPS